MWTGWGKLWPNRRSCYAWWIFCTPAMCMGERVFSFCCHLDKLKTPSRWPTYAIWVAFFTEAIACAAHDFLLTKFRLLNHHDCDTCLVLCIQPFSCALCARNLGGQTVCGLSTETKGPTRTVAHTHHESQRHCINASARNNVWLMGRRKNKSWRVLAMVLGVWSWT